MPFDGASRCVPVEEEKESFSWKELHAIIHLDATFILGDEVKESISFGTLNSSLIPCIFSLHVPYDGSWDFVGTEVEESFCLKALPHLEILYKKFILCKNFETTHGMCLHQLISPLIPHVTFYGI